MTAIITNQFRKNSRELFLGNIATDNDNYFIGIGKSDPWPRDGDLTEISSGYNVPLPSNTQSENKDVLSNLLSLLEVEETFSVIPRNQWVSGRVYKVYDPNDPNIFNFETIGDTAFYPCYVTHNERVFICLHNNDDGISTLNVASTEGFDEAPFNKDDSYDWAYVCDLNPNSNFYTDQFVDIPADVTGDAVAAAADATGGLIYGFNVINGVSTELIQNIKIIGKDLAGLVKTDVTIYDSLTGAVEGYEIAISNNDNTIDSIKFTNINDKLLSGYSEASVVINDTNTDEEVLINNYDSIDIRPLIAPIKGFGYSPRSDLPTFYAGLYGSFAGDLEGEAPLDIGFRQVSLIKNPSRTDNDEPADFTENIYDASQYFTLTQAGSGDAISNTSGTVITQEVTGAKAYLDYVDATNDRIYFHQNSNKEINQKTFNDTSDIYLTLPGASDHETPLNINGVVQGEYNQGSGEVIFIENRKVILRNTNQKEDIKLVIQF